MHRLTRQIPDLAKAERTALAAAAPDVEAAWATARPHLGAEAAALLASAAALAARYAQWWNLVREVRAAVEATHPGGRILYGPSERMGKRPDALAVLAAGHGADLCAVTPPQPVEW